MYKRQGYERALNCLLPVLAGGTLISGFGALNGGTLASIEQLVIDNEDVYKRQGMESPIMAMVRQFRKNISRTATARSAPPRSAQARSCLLYTSRCV